MWNLKLPYLGNIGLFEVKRNYEKLTIRNNGNMFYHFSTSARYRGVGFYIDKKYVKNIVEIKAISERMAMVKIKINKTENLSIFRVYAPNLASPGGILRNSINN